MFANPFSFEGRIRRLEFGLSAIIYQVIVFFIGFILGYIGVTDGVTLRRRNLIFMYYTCIHMDSLARGEKMSRPWQKWLVANNSILCFVDAFSRWSTWG